MISRKTGMAFLLALLLGSGIALWNAWHPDACYHYLRGEPGQLPIQSVEVSGEAVAVPCEMWFPRQTMYMQGACFLEVGVVGILLVLGAGDVVNWLRRRKGLPRLG